MKENGSNNRDNRESLASSARLRRSHSAGARKNNVSISLKFASNKNTCRLKNLITFFNQLL